jgi:hypothetical protein
MAKATTKRLRVQQFSGTPEQSAAIWNTAVEAQRERDAAYSPRHTAEWLDAELTELRDAWTRLILAARSEGI